MVPQINISPCVDLDSNLHIKNFGKKKKQTNKRINDWEKKLYLSLRLFFWGAQHRVFACFDAKILFYIIEYEKKFETIKKKNIKMDIKWDTKF